MSEHKQCEDCGKCRVTEQAEEWCGDCEYFSCERQEDCKDDAADPASRMDAYREHGDKIGKP